MLVVEWPAQNPGMNPIENAWKLLNERPKEKNPRNIEELWTNLKGKWEKISVDECKTLIRSCSKRCPAVIESKGLHLKYWGIMNAIFILIWCIHYNSMILLIVLISLIIYFFQLLYNYFYNKFIELYILELYNLPLYLYFSLIKCSMKL